MKHLTVFGNDYDTPDGSCIRDYFHVVDLAEAHIASCKRLAATNNQLVYEVYNIGTGKGTSVLHIINEFEKLTGHKLNYSFGSRREGYAPIVYADTSFANKQLNWRAQSGLDEMILSAWEWELQLIAGD